MMHQERTLEAMKTFVEEIEAAGMDEIDVSLACDSFGSNVEYDDFLKRIRKATRVLKVALG